jgi:hypothetical protein
MIKISLSENDNLIINHNEECNTYNIEIFNNDDNDCIKRKDVINLIEHYRKGFKKIFLEGDCALDGRGEYSGWFYISCPVIWKSLFRSVFVHTES